MGTERAHWIFGGLQFLTIAPPLIRRPLDPREMGRAVGFFPLVGLLLGGMLFGLDAIARLLWPPAIGAAVVLLAWVLLTGCCTSMAFSTRATGSSAAIARRTGCAS